jgi:hypothetical protein
VPFLFRCSPDPKCHAGCTLDEVLHAAGLSASDLFPDRANAQRRERERFVARQRFAKARRTPRSERR